MNIEYEATFTNINKEYVRTQIEDLGMENKRELWKLDNVEITIDEWPFLEPFVEVEGNSENDVTNVSKKIGFDYSKALFCAVGKLYGMKYGIDETNINNADKIVFDMENPFLK